MDYTKNSLKPNWMNRFNKIISGIVFLLFLLPILSCKSGKMAVERDKKFAIKPDLTKLIVINPMVYMPKYQLQADNKVQQFLRNKLPELGTKQGIEIAVVSETSVETGDVEYFNSIKKLEAEILKANFIQSPYFSQEKNLPRFEETIIVPAGQITPTFAYLADKYNTKYFSMMGFLSYKDLGWPETRVAKALLYPFYAYGHGRSGYRSMFYNIVVDVENGKIVYREIRLLKYRPEKDIIKEVLNDSYRRLKRQFKQD